MSSVKYKDKEYNKRYYGRTRYKYPSRRYTKEEDRLILEHKLTDNEIADIIKHSVKGIQHRRAKLLHQYGVAK